MTRKIPDHVQAAIDECIRLKADFTWTVERANIVGIIAINGKFKKLFMAKTPSDFRAPYKVRTNVRHLVRQLGNGE